jgi:hypothetical protein
MLGNAVLAIIWRRNITENKRRQEYMAGNPNEAAAGYADLTDR